MSLLAPTPQPLTVIAAAPPVGEGEVSVSVDITPNITDCLASCPVEQQPPATPALPVTGAEPVSLLLPAALVIAGLIATVWARRKPERP